MGPFLHQGYFPTMRFLRDAKAVAFCTHPSEKVIILDRLGSSKYTHYENLVRIKVLVSPDWPSIFVFHLTQAECWGQGCRVSPSTPSEAQCWGRNDPAAPVLAGISLVAAALLSGLEQQNFHPLLIVAGFFQVLSEEELPSHLEAGLREESQ